MKYSTPLLWREAAMQRDNLITAADIAQRRAKATTHYASESSQPDADTLADHELYILGKMDMHEYEQYLLFKHSQNNTTGDEHV